MSHLQTLFQQSNPLLQCQQQFTQHFPRQQQPQLYLFTNDRVPANYGSKWADLHPDSQNILLQIEERILEFSDESQRLDQCSRLYDSSVSNDGLKGDASHIVQELGGINTGIERLKVMLHELMANVKGMLGDTEMVVRSFVLLRPRFLHSNTSALSNTATPSQPSGMFVMPGSTDELPSTSMYHVFDFYCGIPKKPSPFLQKTVSRFEKYFGECCHCIEELEQLLLLDSSMSSFYPKSSLSHSLLKIMSNVHDFFVHVAAKVESVNQYVETMKLAFLADQHHRGNGNDPFIEADCREIAKQEAAANRLQPTLHFLAGSQPSTLGAGLFVSATNLEAATAPYSCATTATTFTGSGFFPFATHAQWSSSSPFSAPSAVASSSLFGSSRGSSQTPLLSSSTPFIPSGSTPSLFSTSSSFGLASTGSSFFAAPQTSGAATESTASIGQVSKSSRTRYRNARR